MKLFTFVSLLSFSALAQADIINCEFTEPFVTSSYSTTQSTLTYKTGDNKTTVIKNVSLQIKGSGSFELVGSDQNAIQILTLDKKGSDGMSDRVYPYSVKDLSMTQFANGGVGGCTSNYLKATGNK